MARTKAVLPTGTRIADYLSVGLMAQVCPLAKIHQILQDTGRQSQRQRDLPAHSVVYYVLALGLYMGVAYEEVLRLTLVVDVNYPDRSATTILAGGSGE